ncbi:WD40 repeat domain-containing protein [Nonomuraea sediminis]|uniref:WD40 repeat domain-containing protein n=1 Tax=Nonomuraea sediminis TaxID=2835864 RepID=UPI001BDDC509|nr:WD40 repeat domain-containing protein [Nonomuraea sediminis]
MDGEPIQYGPEFDDLVAELLRGGADVVAVVPEIDGLECAGTTTLARAMCADPRVAEHFSGGVFWYEIGSDGLIRSVGQDIPGEEPGDVLVVFDGLHRHPTRPSAFELAPMARTLLTVRSAAGLPSGAEIIRMPLPERGWPLLSTLSSALGTAQPHLADPGDAAERASAVRRVLAEGLAGLGTPGSVERLLELGVFAADGHVPARMIQLLWRRTADLSEVEAELTLAGLRALGLLRTSFHDDVLVVPEPVMAYLAETLGAEGALRAGRALVEALVEHPWEWLTEAERTYLAVHLPRLMAGIGGPVADLVCGAGWIVTKLGTHSTAYLERDLELAGTPLANRLRRTLAQNAAMLAEAREGSQKTLVATLAGRLHPVSPVAGELRELLRESGHAWLECLWEPPDLPAESLRRSWRAGPDGVEVMAAGPGLLVTGGSEGKVTLWNLDGTIRTEFQAHQDGVDALAVAPDGDWLVTASESVAVVWGLDGTPMARIDHETSLIQKVAVAPDGAWLVTATLEGVVAWRPDGERLWQAEMETGYPANLSIGAAGAWVAVNGPKGSGVQIITWGGTLRGALGLGVDGSAAHPRHDLLVIKDEDGPLRMLRPNGTPAGTIPAGDLYEAITIAPDGTWVAGPGRGGLVVQPLDGRPPSTRAAGHVQHVAIGPDGTWLAGADYDGVIKVWAREDGLPRPDEHLRRRPLWSIAVGSRGDLIATAGPDGVTLWDGEGSDPRTLLEGTACNSVAISPDETWLAATGYDGDLRVVTMSGVMTLMVPAHHRAHAVAISPDGDWIATVGNDDAVVIWRGNGVQVARLSCPDDGWRQLAIAPDGSWVACGGREQVRLWDTATWELRSTLPGADALAVAPDGRWLATGATDGVVRLWDPVGLELAEFEAPGGALNGLAAGPFGSWLAAATAGGLVHVWDVEEEAIIASIHLDQSLTECAWTPGGTRLFGVGGAGLYGFKLHLRG